jgi:hypothetical protein
MVCWIWFGIESIGEGLKSGLLDLRVARPSLVLGLAWSLRPLGPVWHWGSWGRPVAGLVGKVTVKREKKVVLPRLVEE